MRVVYICIGFILTDKYPGNLLASHSRHSQIIPALLPSRLLETFGALNEQCVVCSMQNTAFVPPYFLVILCTLLKELNFFLQYPRLEFTPNQRNQCMMPSTLHLAGLG